MVARAQLDDLVADPDPDGAVPLRRSKIGVNVPS